MTVSVSCCYCRLIYQFGASKTSLLTSCQLSTGFHQLMTKNAFIRIQLESDLLLVFRDTCPLQVRNGEFKLKSCF